MYFGKKVLISISTSFAACIGYCFYIIPICGEWVIIEHDDSTKDKKICTYLKIHAE